MSKKVCVILMLLVAGLLAVMPGAAQEPTVITWFVGLGTGGNPDQLPGQQAVVDAFNAAHTDIQINLIVSTNDAARDALNTLIAAGTPPDIVGPIGNGTANTFAGNFLDLQPLIDATEYDISDFDPATVDFYRIEGQGLTGLPFGVSPSMIFFNRDLFDEAGLDYPPQEFGAPYADGETWDFAKLSEIAQLLTVDANGNDATSADFDPENIVQFGFQYQWMSLRGQMTTFGAAPLVDADGNVTFPENWREFAAWNYDATWNLHGIPNAAYNNSELLANNNPFASGNIGMVWGHLWYTCCIGENVPNWDLAAAPSYNGTITTPLHADTFRILNSTANPEAAFEVLTYLTGEAAPDLLQVYGFMPSRISQQQPFIEAQNERFPQGVNWQVAIDSLSYVDNPSHESNLPAFDQVNDRLNNFGSLIAGTAGLDINAELDTLQTDLQALVSEAE